MSDDTNTEEQPTEREAPEGDKQESSDLGEKGTAAIKAERDARKRAERDLKSAQTRVAELENAGKSEDEKRTAALKVAEERATAAEQRLRDANARSAVTDAATKLNAISTRAVYALIRGDLDFDDDGEPTNVAKLLKQAQADEPSLFRASNGSGDGGAGAEPETRNINDLLRASMRRG